MPLHVDFAVAAGVRDGGDHAGLRRQVEDRAGLHLGDRSVERSEVDDVQLEELGVGGDPVGVAGGEVVDHGHRVAVGEQRVDDV